MKIGFLGNANNYPFMLARAVRSLGHDVVFVLMNDPRWRLDRPENRYADTTPPYPDWIHDAGNVDLWNASRCSPRQPELIEKLRPCDAVVLNQYGLCLAAAIGRPTVALLTGTDLLTLADRSFVNQAVIADGSAGHPLRSVRKLARNFYAQRIEAQRFAIRWSVMANYMPPGVTPKGDKILSDLGVRGPRRTSFFMTDTEAIQPAPPPHNQPVRVFCATRFTWDRTASPLFTDLDYKGSDVMIKGLGRFVRHGTPLEIHLVKKGEHLRQTIELVQSEGLSEHVVWHEEMSQTEVWRQFRLADIVLEQFGTSAVGMAGWDAMAMGRPVIAHGRPEAVVPAHGRPLPVCQAATPKEVCQQLERLVPNRAERVRVGTTARRAMEEHLSATHAARVVLEQLERFKRDEKAQQHHQRGLRWFERRQQAYRRRQHCLLELLKLERWMHRRGGPSSKVAPLERFHYSLRLNSHLLRLKGNSLLRPRSAPQEHPARRV